MTQMMLNMRAAFTPAELARRVVGFAIVIGGAVELGAQARHADCSTHFRRFNISNKEIDA